MAYHQPFAVVACALAALILLAPVPQGGRAAASERIDLAQVSIADALSNTVVVRARIADVFGDRVLIEDATGRILVELAPSTVRPTVLEAGQSVEVEGRLRGRTIEARRVALTDASGTGAAPSSAADGTAAAPAVQQAPAAVPRPASSADALIAQLSRPADPATIRSTLEAVGLQPAGPPVRKNKHTEIATRDAAGRAWTASLDRFGRLEEIELDDYDDDTVPSRPRFEATEVTRIVARAGYTPRADPTRRSEHFEIIALSGQSDLVEVHVDFAGTIYKVEWIR